jgi:hypothetical protein
LAAPVADSAALARAASPEALAEPLAAAPRAGSPAPAVLVLAASQVQDKASGGAPAPVRAPAQVPAGSPVAHLRSEVVAVGSVDASGPVVLPVEPGS